MNEIKLEQYYKGDENWIKYSNQFSYHWTNSDFEIRLLGYLDYRLDFAKVIYYHLQENSLSWIYSKVPELDDLTPIECLNDKKLINRLKVMLMRFPC